MKKSLLLLICLASWSCLKAQNPVQLPQPEIGKLSMSLGKVLSTRRSYREYQKGKEVDLQTLSTILWAACGVSDPASGKITAPSAINMQDIKVYVCTSQGVSLYHPQSNTLQPVSDKNLLDALATSQQFVKDAPYTLLLVSDQSAGGRKNERFGDMDAGYVSQNIYLACTALGMRTVARAMMNQEVLRQELNLPEGISIELNHPIGY